MTKAMESVRIENKRNPFAIQFSLKTILLLFLCIGILLAYWLTAEEAMVIEVSLPELAEIAGEVNVQNDSELLACHSGFMFEEGTWHIFVPDSGEYHLSLVQSWNAITDNCETRILTTLGPGQHRISIIPENWFQLKNVDGKFEETELGDTAQVVLNNDPLAEIDIKQVGGWGPLPLQNPVGALGGRLSEPAVIGKNERVVIRCAWGGRLSMFAKGTQTKEVCLVVALDRDHH